MMTKWAKEKTGQNTWIDRNLINYRIGQIIKISAANQTLLNKMK